MANTLDGGSFPEVWAKEMQREHHKKDVFRAICTFKEEPNLKTGDVVNLPYRGSVYTEGYTRGSAVTPRNLTNAADTLTVNQVRVVPFYISHCVLAWKQALNNLAISGNLLIKRTIPTEAYALSV